MAPDPRTAAKSSNPNTQNGQQTDSTPDSKPTFQDLLAFLMGNPILSKIDACEQELYSMEPHFNRFTNTETERAPAIFIAFLNSYIATKTQNPEPWKGSLDVQLSAFHARSRAREASRSIYTGIPSVPQSEKMKKDRDYQIRVAISTGREIEELPQKKPYVRSTSVQQEPVFYYMGGRTRIAREGDTTQQKTLAQIARKVANNLKKVHKPKVVKQSALQKILKHRKTY